MITKTLAPSKCGVVHHALRLFGSNALSHLLFLATSPLLVRLYSGAQFGTFAVFNSYIGIVAGIVCLRYDAALVGAASTGQLIRLSALSVMCALASSLASSLILLGFIQAGTLSFAQLPHSAALLAGFYLFFFGISLVLRGTLLRAGDFGTLSRLTFFQASCRSAVALVSGVAGIGWIGLGLGEIAGKVAGNGARPFEARLIGRLLTTPKRFRLIWKTAKQFKVYPLAATLSQLIDAGSSGLPVILVATLFSPAEAGILFLLNRTVTAPITVLAGCIADPLQKHLQDISASAPRELNEAFRTHARKLFFFSTTGAFLTALLLTPTLQRIWGREYAEVGYLANLALPAIWAAAIVAPLSRVLIILNRPQLKLLYDLTSLTLTCGCFYAAQRFGMGFHSTIMLLSWLNLAAYVLYFSLCWHAIQSLKSVNTRSCVESQAS